MYLSACCGGGADSEVYQGRTAEQAIDDLELVRSYFSLRLSFSAEAQIE